MRRGPIDADGRRLRVVEPRQELSEAQKRERQALQEFFLKIYSSRLCKILDDVKEKKLSHIENIEPLITFAHFCNDEANLQTFRDALIGATLDAFNTFCAYAAQLTKLDNHPQLISEDQYVRVFSLYQIKEPVNVLKVITQMNKISDTLSPVAWD